MLESLEKIIETKESLKECSEQEIEHMDKVVRDTEAGHQIFEKLKDDVLEETFQILEQGGRDFRDMGEHLSDEHEVQIQDFTREMDDLGAELEGRIGRLNEGQREMITVASAQQMRAELVDYVQRTVHELAQQEGQLDGEKHEIRRTEAEIVRVTDGLQARLRRLQPSDLRRR